MPGPLDMLQALAKQEVELAPGLRHVEVYTMGGLLTILWHGDRDAPGAVVLGGGAMGGMLGPGRGLYHWVGQELAAPGSGIAVLRVGWRKPNDLDRCTLDLLAAADLAARAGALTFVTGGHSFGGAIAVRAALAMGDWSKGVVTFATQSAGCEQVEEMTAPLLAFHGTDDEILPLISSQAVCQLVGGPTELVVCEGAGHLLSEAEGLLQERVPGWIRERLAEPPGPDRSGAVTG